MFELGVSNERQSFNIPFIPKPKVLPTEIILLRDRFSEEMEVFP